METLIRCRVLVSDLGLHCSPITLYGSPNYNGLKYCWMSVDPDQMPKNLNWFYTFPQTCLGKYLDKYGTCFYMYWSPFLKENADWKQAHSFTKLWITKMCLYNFDPLKPHFYNYSITGVYRSINYFSYFCSET